MAGYYALDNLDSLIGLIRIAIVENVTLITN